MGKYIIVYTLLVQTMLSVKMFTAADQEGKG